MVPNYSSREDYEKLFAMGVTMYVWLGQTNSDVVYTIELSINAHQGMAR